MFNDYIVSVLQDEESSGGRLHKTVHVWNLTAKRVAFMLCIFYHNLKIFNLKCSYRTMDMGGREASPRTHVQWKSQFRWWRIGKLEAIPSFFLISPLLLPSLLWFHLHFTIRFCWTHYWEEVSSSETLGWKQNMKGLEGGESRVGEMSRRPAS